VSSLRLTVRQLAAFCSVSISTIKDAEEKGRIPKAHRDWNNYRYWTSEEAEKVKKIIESPKKKSA